MDTEKNNYEMTEQSSLGGSVATKFLNEVHGARSLSQVPTDATASPTQAKLPEMVIGTTTENPTEGSKSGIGDNVNGKASNKLDLTKCDTKFRNPSEVDSRTAGKKVNDVQSASPDGSSQGPARDGSNEPFDAEKTPVKEEQNNEKSAAAEAKDVNGSGEGFDSKQKESQESEQEELEKAPESGLETDDETDEKSAEEEDVELRNDDPLIDETEDGQTDPSDEDPYVKLEAGQGVKDGPPTNDEEVPTQILVMKDGRPIPRSHGVDAGREKEGLPNSAYEQALLIESLWR